MGRQGLTWPNGANFFGSFAANGEHEIKFWRVGPRKFFPVLWAQAVHVVVQPLKQIESVRMHFTLRLASSRKGSKPTLSGAI
jgi:hypothetical protein